MQTIPITGCSSGYGQETARHFHAKGWRVIATMRTPRAEGLPQSERLQVLALDVTKPESIAAALDAAGPIDVLVNNAGIGAFGALEASPLATARTVFETNTFGVMAMTQAVIPQMRARRSGVIVNVTSSVVLAPHPLVSVYAASKWAIEGFTECLAPELGAIGVRAKLVQPGYGPTTRFTQNTPVDFGAAIPRPTGLSRSRSSPPLPRSSSRRRRRMSPTACGAPSMTRAARCAFRQARRHRAGECRLAARSLIVIRRPRILHSVVWSQAPCVRAARAYSLANGRRGGRSSAERA